MEWKKKRKRKRKRNRKRKMKRLPAYGGDIGSALENWEDWSLDWEEEEESQRKEESASDWTDWNDWNVSWEEEKELDMQAEMETQEERDRKAMERETKAMERKVEREKSEMETEEERERKAMERETKAMERKVEREKKAMERKVEREKKAMERKKDSAKKKNALLEEAMLYFTGPGVELPKDEESRLELRLSCYGFMRVEIEQDKHALFRILSLNIFGTESHHDFIRRCVADQLKRNRYLYSKQYPLKDLGSYCDEVAKDHYGDKLTFTAACDLFRIKFVTLFSDDGLAISEVAPTIKLHSEKQNIFRKVIYSLLSGGVRHGIVFKPDQHPDSVNDHVEFPILKEQLDYIDICQNLLRHLPGTVVPKDEIERRRQRLDTFGFKLKKIIGDGNCMFRFLSDQIYDNQERHPHMRRIIVEKLKAHPERYSNLRTDTVLETYKNYCSRMAIDKEWGGPACLQAACDAFGVKIIQLCTGPHHVFNEIDPIGPCKKVIYGCSIIKHMDAMSVRSGRSVGSLPAIVSTSCGNALQHPKGGSKLLDLSGDEPAPPNSSAGNFLQDLLGGDIMPSL